MSEGGPSLLDRLRGKGKIQNVTSEIPAPATGMYMGVDRGKDPGATGELHPDDAAAIAERAASDKRKSDAVATGVLNGVPAHQPVEPKGPQSTFKPQTES